MTAKNRAEFINLKVRKQLLEPVGPHIAALREGLQSLLCHGGKEWREAFGILTEEVGNVMEVLGIDVAVESEQSPLQSQASASRLLLVNSL